MDSISNNKIKTKLVHERQSKFWKFYTKIIIIMLVIMKLVLKKEKYFILDIEIKLWIKINRELY